MASFNTNLVLNPGAEQGTASATDGPINPPPDWTTTGTFTEQVYGTLDTAPPEPPAPADGGSNFFFGGPSNAESTATQDISIGDLGSAINSGNVTATLSGELGGFSSQNDHTILSVTWLDASGNSLGTLTAPTVTAGDRGNASGLLPVSIDGAVPAGAVTARVEMDAIRTDGADNDGYADNISLVLKDNTACYASGTAIMTVRGHVCVEDLVVGDLVVTASGAHRPIKWIGHRAYAGRFANGNPDVLPICFKAGSLDDNVPARDLWVSPKHAMFLDGALFPAEVLVNGVSVVKAERVESVTYWHVELDSHDVLIAEGAASESFVDDASRGMFHNARTFAEMYPDEAAPVAAVYCAPRIEDGHRLETVRRAIAARAGIASHAPDCGALHGYIEALDGAEVRGWVCSALNPAMPVCLDLVVDGRVVTQALANRPRADLEAAGYGPHAFAIPLPAGAAGRNVEVRRSADGARLRLVRDRAA